MKYKLGVLLVIGIWLGMLFGISFLEAPLKFQAPDITLPLGLGIGKLVFSALNKVEICFSLFMLFFLIYNRSKLILTIKLLGGIVLFIIAIQSFWLIPILNARADAIIAGVEIAKTSHHFFYVIFEGLKIILLMTSFVKIYKTN